MSNVKVVRYSILHALDQMHYFTNLVLATFHSRCLREAFFLINWLYTPKDVTVAVIIVEPEVHSKLQGCFLFLYIRMSL